MEGQTRTPTRFSAPTDTGRSANSAPDAFGGGAVDPSAFSMSSQADSAKTTAGLYDTGASSRPVGASSHLESFSSSDQTG